MATKVSLLYLNMWADYKYSLHLTKIRNNTYSCFKKFGKHAQQTTCRYVMYSKQHIQLLTNLGRFSKLPVVMSCMLLYGYWDL